MTSAAHPGVAPTPTGSPTVAAIEERRKNPMEQFIDTVINWTVVPFANAIPGLVASGVFFAVFALLWIAFGVGLIWSQGSLDSAWQWIRDLPLIAQAVVWVLFLPVVAGLWVWETTWPFIVRLVLVAGLAWWNLFMFLPRAATSIKP
jgi:hypothetical protein